MAGRPLQSLRLRQATVQFLRSDPDVIAAGDPPLADRIYARRTPPTLTWPFVRVNNADEGSLRKGTQVRVTVHTFSKAQFDDEVEQLNALMQAALEDKTFDLSPSVTAYFVWIASQVVEDAAEASAWHGINSFTATIG
jgi:hypothetical protein